MDVRFYETAAGRRPVQEYVDSLSLRDQAVAIDTINAIREHGLAAVGVRFRQIEGKLWEFYVTGDAGHRVFYVTVDRSAMILLHAYKKQGQKAPSREIDVAKKRMKEVL